MTMMVELVQFTQLTTKTYLMVRGSQDGSQIKMEMKLLIFNLPNIRLTMLLSDSL